MHHRKSLTSESDNERPRTQSTDSEPENNGSRSPLLDTKTRAAIFTESQKQNAKCDSKTTNSTDNKTNDSFATEDLEGAVGGVNIPLPSNAPPNTKSEDSGCPSSDCEQASASSKDMLLSKDQKPSMSDWCDFSIDSNSIAVDVSNSCEGCSKNATKGSELKEQTEKNKKTRNYGESASVSRSEDTNYTEMKSLGAIPKTTHCRHHVSDETDDVIMVKSVDQDNIKSCSRASSSNSCSGTSSDFENIRHPLEVLQQTKDGWILQSASSNNPYLVAQRGELPPLLPIYNTRPDNLFPVSRKPYLYLHPPHRQYQPKMRSSRNRRNNSSIDTNGSSRDEDNSSLTPAAGGSGSIGSGWDFLDVEVQESINTFIIQELMEDQYKQSLPSERIVQPTQRTAVNRMGFGDSIFWGHYNLPPEKQVHPKRYYKFPFKCFGKHDMKISMDRLQLMALFDRDFGLFQAIIAIVLAALVSILGSIVLCLGLYKDIYAFIFCFVIAGSQFSLLKSVQPDASSPIHGFNKTVSYSRPIYFCLCSIILIIAYHMSSASPPLPSSLSIHTIQQLTLFGIPFSSHTFFFIVKELMSVILLLMPILFSFGLFPQINTFLMYVLEQVDMHIFGGNAVCSLLSAFLGVFRSVLTCCLLYGFAFGGLSEPRSTQHVLFSCFCALLVATAYHLSRSASDVTYLWAIIKSNFLLHTDDDEDLKKSQQVKLNKIEKKTSKHSDGENAAHDDSNCDKHHNRVTKSISLSGDGNDSKTNTLNNEQLDEKSQNQLDDPLPGKLKNTVNLRLKNDFLVCTVVGALVLSLHSSTVFTVLQPELNPVLQAFVIVIGFILHYIIPQMRKYLPWLCFAKPILKQNEFGMFETREAAKVMWFESVYVCLSFFERNVLLPLVFLSALTSDSAAVSQKFGVPIGAAIAVICGLKCKLLVVRTIHLN